MILLDTNVISETMRARPDPLVSAWLDAFPKHELWTASVVIAELLSGIDLMPAGRKKEALREGTEALIAEDFRGQVLNSMCRQPVTVAIYWLFANS
jgi:predicted nucleic acid-binding protein